MSEPTRLTVEEIEAGLRKLVLYPARESVRSVRFDPDPRVWFDWARGETPPFEVVVEWGSRVHRFQAEVVSKGKSMYLRGQTHRLAPEYIERLARAIHRERQKRGYS